MTSKELGILNALVTFAAENVPGGLSEDERKVAMIVGRMASNTQGTKAYVYKEVNSSLLLGVAQTAESWSERGWRVVAVVSDTRSGYAHSVVLERPVWMTHPDD